MYRKWLYYFHNLKTHIDLVISETHIITHCINFTFKSAFGIFLIIDSSLYFISIGTVKV